MATRSATDHLTQAEAAERAAAVQDVGYGVHLDLPGDPAAPDFGSTSRISFSCPRDGTSTFLNLAPGEAGRLEAVRVDGTPAPAAVAGFHGSRIPLGSLGAGRHTVEVAARCTFQHVGVGLHRAVDPVDANVYLHTHFEPFDAHKVFACFDQPDLKGPFELSVSAPAAWEVCSNGPAVSRDEQGDGSHLWRFAPTPPLPPYLTAMVSGDFRVIRTDHHGIPLALYGRRSLAVHMEEQAEEIFAITRSCLDFYAEEFGFAYPFGKYDQLFVPEFNVGAMENPGCVTFNEMYVFRSRATELQRSRRAEVIAHEMAHVCGFGDVVTMRWWGDLWLNETFATYMAARAMVAATEFTKAWVDFANTMKAQAARQDQLPSTHPVSTPCADTDEVRQNFDGITYQKGASILKQLVAWVGEEAFTEGVRDYFRRYRWGNADLREFLDCIEGASGRDLTAWSAEWLETAGMNTLRPEVEMDGSRILGFAIAQSAAPEHPTLRSHHVRVGLYRLRDGSLARVHQVDAEVSGARTEVPALRGQPAADLVVANDDDLTFAKLRFDPRSTRTLLEHLGGLEDALTRAVCWAALWDMTRDGELPTRDFVAAVLRHSRTENEVTVLERLLSQALAAIDQFGDPIRREASRLEVAAASWDALTGAAPGSDLQLTWARTHIAAATGDADLDRLERLLDGVESIPGLPLDTDLRWMIVARLAASGRDGGERVDAQLAADPTDFGRRRAAACRAARPDPQAKAEAWERVTEVPGPQLQMLHSIMAGFGVGAFGMGGIIQWGETQARLLRPYAQRWAAAVPGQWASRDREEAEAFTELLYPRQLVEPETVALAGEVLAAIEGSALPEQARRDASRILIEARDGTERALRARLCDIRRE